MKIAILGLSITSSWGNGHATTYRGLVRNLAERHQVLFLERDMPWYAAHRDLKNPPYGRTELYSSLKDLKARFGGALASADLIVVGSYVPEGALVIQYVLDTARGAVAFYDIDTPITLARLAAGNEEYLALDSIPRFDLYLSFTGGPTLQRLEKQFGARRVRALYCSVDPAIYSPEKCAITWDLGYLGTYSADRQPTLERLFLEPARNWPEGRFAVAGSLYPDTIDWPRNIHRIEHLPPAGHRRFYNSQRYTLNVTRSEMMRAGYSPSVRLFEAAACGTAIITDCWKGLEEIFQPGREILVADSPCQMLKLISDTPEAERRKIGWRARRRVLKEHTSAHRAAQLERYVIGILGGATAELPPTDALRIVSPARE